MAGHTHHVEGKNLFITIILNLIITLSQIIGGIASGSLALLSDALHNFSDVVTLVLAYIAHRLALRAPNKSKTFGYKRAEILATLFNASVLVGIGVFLIIHAIEKFNNPVAINSVWVIALGTLSIVLNTISVLLIKNDAHNNMNIKAAYLHLFTDVMTSIVVVVGGVLMYYFDLYYIDPVASVMIALYLIWASVGLIKNSFSVLMQFTPETVDIDTLVKHIQQTPQIHNAHHLHIWRLDEHTIFLEAHLDFDEDITLSRAATVINNLEKQLKEAFDISHVTFQCEYNRCENKEAIAH